MRYVWIVLLSAFCLSQAEAQSPPPAQRTGSTGVLGDVVDIVFKDAEKRAIEKYYDIVPGAQKPETDADKNKTNARKKNDDDDKDEERKKRKDKDRDKDMKLEDKDKSSKGHGRGNGLPPGLAKRAQLPPGLAKRGNKLPAGLMKGDLPSELESKLPPLPKNVERVIVDNDVLLVQKGTDLILDVLEGVIRGQ